ncbi:MAG: hypothetical protein AAFZ65_13790 [Planctomycetota bacterium]
MKLGLSHSARMEQRLVQSPQMIQAMQILQLSSLDLAERIEQELLENPLLEVDEETRAAAEATSEVAPTEERNDSDSVDQRELDSVRDEYERYELDLEEIRRRTAGGDGDEGDRKLEALANTPERPRSLAAALIEQLALVDLDERRKRIAEFLVFSLDDRGYLPDPLEDVARACSPEIVAFELERQREDLSPEELAALLEATAEQEGADPHPWCVGAEEVAEVLDVVRRATHAGLGAIDLRDCLLLQLEALGEEHSLAHELVEHWLEDITKNRLPRVAKETGASLDEIKAALDQVRELDPSPGREFGDALATTIVPDVVVEEIEGELQVRSGRQRTPDLRVSPSYMELLEGYPRSNGRASDKEGEPREHGSNESGVGETASDPQEPPASRDAPDAAETRKWLRKRLESARWFIDALDQRQSTVLRIAGAIFERQRAFLADGPKGLKSLRMQEVADDVGVHISTVSRAVAGKHVQTERGIFPLKYFFSSGTTDAAGADASQVAIQQRIRELVDGEEKAAPLSDEQLAAALQERHGIKIARRTVTKYRKLLEIPSSTERKTF